MAYDIVFTQNGRSALRDLGQSEQRQVRTKLFEIASCEFRSPTEWDFCSMAGPAEGRFRIGDGLRVAADVDDRRELIRVHRVSRRENLYA